MLFFTITNLKSARKHKWRGELLSRLFWIQHTHILISIFFSMFVWPLPSISAEFLSNKVTSVDTVWWRDMSLVTTILLYFNVVILVHYPITIYINLFIFLYYVCLCHFNFFLKFIFTFSFAKNFIFCKLFSKIKLLLTYLLYFPLCTSTLYFPCFPSLLLIALDSRYCPIKWFIFVSWKFDHRSVKRTCCSSWKWRAIHLD